MQQQGHKIKYAQKGNNSAANVKGAGTQDATIYKKTKKCVSENSKYPIYCKRESSPITDSGAKPVQIMDKQALNALPQNSQLF